MNYRPLQSITQFVGMLTLIAFALFGVMSMANLDTSFVEASSAETDTDPAGCTTSTHSTSTELRSRLHKSSDRTLRAARR